MILCWSCAFNQNLKLEQRGRWKRETENKVGREHYGRKKVLRGRERERKRE